MQRRYVAERVLMDVIAMNPRQSFQVSNFYCECCGAVRRVASGRAVTIGGCGLCSAGGAYGRVALVYWGMYNN
jgi:hypothetical protein